MKHPSLKLKVLIRKVTVPLGQFKWGTFLLKGNGEVHKVG